MVEAISPKTESPQEREERQRGRRRLIGAVTIAALMVVFLPMLFDSDPPPRQSNLSLTIPAKDGVSALTIPNQPATQEPSKAAKATPASAPPNVTAAAPATVPPATASSTPPTVVAGPAASPSAAAPPARPPAVVASLEPAKPASPVAPPIKAAPPSTGAAPASTPATTKPEKAESPLAGFAVQLGAFRDAKRVDDLKKRLADLKINHFLERRDTADGELVRFRAGPFSSRAEAEAIQKKLAANGLEGSIVSLQ